MVDIAAPLLDAKPHRSAGVARLRRAGLELAPPCVVLIALLGGWEFAIDALGVNSYVLPPPSAIAASIVEMTLDGSLAANLLVTGEEALCGLLIAVIAGLAIGALVAHSPLFERTVYGYLVAIQTMPKIALAPLFVAWFGFGLASKVSVAALIAFFPMLVNVIVGLKSCDEGKIDVLRALAASEWRIFWLVRLPFALPYIFAGLNVAVVFALTGAIVGEFVGARDGLGYQMLMANSAMDIPQVFGVLVVLGAIGLALSLAVDALRRRVLYWSPAAIAANSTRAGR
jgi:NitT/TauT family transport system permease protein